ncbi:hypothetical protein GCM10020001_016970 [Nonomuraea salmonea]
MPVAVAPIDRHPGDRAQRLDQVAVLLVDRADPAEALVVLGHFEQPLARHATAAHDVLQERHHVVGTLGAAEREDQQGVVNSHVTTLCGDVGGPRREVGSVG